MKTVIIDVGHHENDTGAVHNDIREVDLNISIAEHLVRTLRQHGVRVIITSGTLQSRVQVEHQTSPAYFISIHNNAGGGDGAEVLVYKNVYPQRKLAENILKHVVSDGCNNSRGIKERTDLFVLRKTLCPAVLIECAFVDSKDAEAVDTEEERKVFGVAIAKGILETLNIEYIKEVEKKQKYYRVSVGSFKKKENADKVLEIAKGKGFKDAFITTVEV